MPERLFAALEAAPASRVRLSGAGTDADLTTRALLAAADDLAQRLTSRGRRLLAVLADNGPAWVAADLGALRAGVAHLPLPPFFSPEQLRHALAASGADAALTDRPEVLRALAPDFLPLGTWQGLHLLGREIHAVPLPKGTAKVSFTSGSTGAPKGVCLDARGLVDTAAALVATLADLPLERHLTVLPLALLLENVAGVYAPLLRGMAIHLPPLASLGWRGMAGIDVAELDAQVAATRPQSVILVPELLKAWTGHLEARGLRAPCCLEFVAVGGARCDPQLLAAARGRGLPAFEGYGLTECGSVVSLNRPGADRPGSVGQPLPHVALAAGVGEVVVAGRGFLGYLGQAGTAPRPWPTGDLGHLDDAGFLHLTGRKGSLIVTGYGRNVSPEWVEAALLAQPAVAQALVAGEAMPALAAVLVPAPGAATGALAAAVAAANEALPDYARVRRWLAAEPFTAADGLATGNGRPRRQAILARYAMELERLTLEETTA